MKEESAINKTAYKQDYFPPVPTGFTRALRTNFLWQLMRFVVINLKMIRIVWKSHH